MALFSYTVSITFLPRSVYSLCSVTWKDDTTRFRRDCFISPKVLPKRREYILWGSQLQAQVRYVTGCVFLRRTTRLGFRSSWGFRGEHFRVVWIRSTNCDILNEFARKQIYRSKTAMQILSCAVLTYVLLLVRFLFFFQNWGWLKISHGSAIRYRIIFAFRETQLKF